MGLSHIQIFCEIPFRWLREGAGDKKYIMKKKKYRTKYIAELGARKHHKTREGLAVADSWLLLIATCCSLMLGGSESHRFQTQR